MSMWLVYDDQSNPSNIGNSPARMGTQAITSWDIMEYSGCVEHGTIPNCNELSIIIIILSYSSTIFIVGYTFHLRTSRQTHYILSTKWDDKPRQPLEIHVTSYQCWVENGWYSYSMGPSKIAKLVYKWLNNGLWLWLFFQPEVYM